jgi:hypothetical protein
MRRRSASEVKPCSLIFHLLRMVVQYFILRGRSNKLMIFKSRRMRLYSLLKLQKRKKRSAGSKQRKRNNAYLKSAREFKHLSKNYAA